MQNFSLHTHTIEFDGQSTVEEMVCQARQVGLSRLGISNHFIVHKNIKDSKMYAYAVKGGYASIYNASFEEVIERFKAHYNEIDRVGKETGFKIYKGMEVDFFSYDGWREGFEKAREILKPDYLIGSAHFVAYQDTLYNAHDLKNASKEEQNMLLYKYYQNVQAAAQCGLFNFMAHLDLMKKVGLGIEKEWADIERTTVEVIAKNHGNVEINTSGFKLGYDEPYPSKRILNLLAEYNVPVILSDDAHNKKRLGDGFKKAEQLAYEAGIHRFYNPFESDKFMCQQKDRDSR